MDIPIIQVTEEQTQMLSEEYMKKMKDCNLPDPCKVSNSGKIDDVKLCTPPSPTPHPPPLNLENIFEYILV